jgi:hypothetical protein
VDDMKTARYHPRNLFRKLFHPKQQGSALLSNQKG